MTKWFCRENQKARSQHTLARLPNHEARRDMPRIRFTGRFCSLRASATGLSKRESSYATSAPIIPRDICAIALDGRVLALVMLPRSGT
jgi:hypothetical protein